MDEVVARNKAARGEAMLRGKSEPKVIVLAVSHRLHITARFNDCASSRDGG
jgi:hypothetical protein